MDCHNGGELFYHIRQKKRFSEIEAKFYFAQILLAIEFLHKNKIIYRDLKPENILLDRNGFIKITDFGLAKEMPGGEESSKGFTKTFCGTPEYLSPEIIKGEKYGKAVDIWCMGIILFEMLYGFPPYCDKNRNKLFKKIVNQGIDFSQSLSVNLSPSTKDLIVKLLDKNPQKRIKINEIKAHKYFQKFDFEGLLNENIRPPFIPDLNGKDHFNYLDPNLIGEKIEDSVETKQILLKDVPGFTFKQNGVILNN